MWNPLQTLSGRLILVTVAAIGLSHAAAIAVLTQERGDAMRGVIEGSLSQRIVDIAAHLQATPGDQRTAALQRVGGWMGGRMHLSNAPAARSTPLTGVAARVAHAVSARLDNAEVRASVQPARPGQGFGMRPMPPREDWRQGAAASPGGYAARWPPDGPPPFSSGPGGPGPIGPERMGVGPTGPGQTGAIGPGPPQRMMFWRGPGGQDLTVSVAIAPSQWLNVVAMVPAPQPLPRSVIYTAIGSMLAMSLGAFLVARQIGQPLADLAEAAERLGRGEDGAMARVQGPNDVRRASLAFNEMSGRLRRQLDRQRHMLWALSHDLRTPITAMRLRAEMVADEAVRQRLLASLSEMETMAAQALSLARAGASDEPRVEIDIAELVRTLATELSELGRNVVAQAPDEMRVICRPSEMARAIRNLAENAALHAGGGVVKVSRKDSNVLIDVTDKGPGIPDALHAAVTEPFFRANAARSGGSGLGLAIAQAIVEGHGGRLSLENRVPLGLRARIILPMAQPRSPCRHDEVDLRA